jgi:hypothetical protein
VAPPNFGVDDVRVHVPGSLPYRHCPDLRASWHGRRRSAAPPHVRIMHARVLAASVSASRQPRGQPGRRCLSISRRHRSPAWKAVCATYIDGDGACTCTGRQEMISRLRPRERKRFFYTRACLPVLSSTQTCVRTCIVMDRAILAWVEFNFRTPLIPGQHEICLIFGHLVSCVIHLQLGQKIVNCTCMCNYTSMCTSHRHESRCKSNGCRIDLKLT